MFQSPSKFNQNGIFGLKINHLATLQLLFLNGVQVGNLKSLKFACAQLNGFLQSQV
jgi:hypothetical protein